MTSSAKIQAKRLALLASLALSASMLPIFAQAETIEEALASAYASNPQLEAQRAAQRATDENVPQALSGWRPTVTINSSYASQNQKEKLLNSTYTIDSKPLSATVVATQNIFTFGRIEGAIDRAEASVLAGRAVLNATEQTVLLAAATAYLDTVQAQSVVDLTRNNVEVLTRQLEATRDRFRVGEITRTDVAQAEAALAAAKSELIGAEAALANAKAAYERQVGHAPEKVAQPKTLPTVPPTFEEARATALSRSPSLQASRRAEEASRAGIEVARSALLPSLVAQGSYAYNEAGTLIGSSAQTAKIRTGQVGIQLQVPLNTSGLGYSQVRQAKHTNSQDRINIATAERQVIEATVDSWEGLRAARGQIQSGEENVRSNEIALDGVRQEAAVGSRTTLDVLNAEQALLNARVGLVRAQRNAAVASFQVLNAIGKLTPVDLGLSATPYDPTINYNKVRDSWFGADTK
jgi:TolC family type I secretion outer membrane protein